MAVLPVSSACRDLHAPCSERPAAATPMQSRLHDSGSWVTLLLLPSSICVPPSPLPHSHCYLHDRRWLPGGMPLPLVLQHARQDEAHLRVGDNVRALERALVHVGILLGRKDIFVRVRRHIAATPTHGL